MTEDAELLKKRIIDDIQIAEAKFQPKFIGFLSEAEQQLAGGVLQTRCCNYHFYGGIDGAERMILGLFPPGAEIDERAFPVSIVKFTYRKQDTVTHRDVLGSLMALGIARAGIGDIVIGQTEAYAAAFSEIAKFIVSEIKKIGRTGVRTEICSAEEAAALKNDRPRYSEIRMTVTSKRIDCIVAAMCRTGRSKAAELIEGGLVSVNSAPVLKVTKLITDGAVISVRGFGKYKICDCNEISKKGRIILTALKYI